LNPVILILIFAYISLIVPMLEEALKPFGVWLLARINITPAQGFAYGVLCGTGFGLFENLGNTSGAGEAWVGLASARITTLLLHSLNTGLVGWALASAWTERRYIRLVITYVYAVLMHGAWNGLAVIAFLGSLQGITGQFSAANLQRSSLATIGIATLGAFNLVFFIVFSNNLRRSAGIKIGHPTANHPATQPVKPTESTLPPTSNDENADPEFKTEASERNEPGGPVE
jgi:RsiW-degrading membrane proteinase PrsW (M82 family)